MNILEGVEVSLWDIIGGNKLLTLIMLFAFWGFICALLNNFLSKKTVSIAAGVGSIILIGYWATKTFSIH